MNKYAALTADQLEEHLSNYLIDSWSYSAVSCFCRNEKAFEQQYVFGEKTRRSPSSIAGNAYHNALAYYFGRMKENPDSLPSLLDLTAQAFAYLDEVPANDWGLTDSVPTVDEARLKANDAVTKLLTNFASEASAYTDDIAEVLAVEERFDEWVTINGVDIPLPCHGIIDLAVRTADGRTVIIDHKSKGKFTDEEEVKLVHGKQAVTYTKLWESRYPEQPVAEVRFIENKISANRDKSPQLVTHSLMMDDDSRRIHEMLLYEGLRAMLKAVSDPDHIYLINDTDNLSDRADLYAFWMRTLISEVDDFDIPEDKKDLIAKRLRKTRDASTQMISPKVISTFQKKAASFVTFDYTNSNMTNSEKIEHKLRTLGLQMNVAHEIHGFSSDAYLMEAGAGTEISRIYRYHRDLANALDVPDVRIADSLTVHEGHSYVSVEVTRAQGSRTLLPWDAKYLEGHRIPLGLDNYGGQVFWDLDNHSTPHMLVCGASGSGKSVCVRSTIEYAKLAGISDIIVMDPKYEFCDIAGVSVYNDILDIEKKLIELVDLMQKKTKSHDSSMTLVVFDEFADAQDQARKGKALQRREKVTSMQPTARGFRLVEKEEVTGEDRPLIDNIKMLLQKGRSAGFRFIIATQRASVKTIGGDIKVNLPVRVCFRVPTATDSGVVLDSPGAEMLAGRGDGLVRTPERMDEIVRFQGFLYR